MRSFKSAFSAEFLSGLQKGTLSYTYRGVQCLKNPLDMAIYQQILWDLKPRAIIEIGTRFGGSALFFADIAQTFGLDAPVFSIDIENTRVVDDPRITFLEGDVHDLHSAFSKAKIFDQQRPWFVVEDSAHTYSACLAALRFFADVMLSGDMLVIEDGILDELGLSEQCDGGPNRAIAEFFSENPNAFRVEYDLCDRYGTNATYNPNAYLKKL